MLQRADSSSRQVKVPRAIPERIQLGVKKPVWGGKAKAQTSNTTQSKTQTKQTTKKKELQKSNPKAAVAARPRPQRVVGPRAVDKPEWLSPAPVDLPSSERVCPQTWGEACGLPFACANPWHGFRQAAEPLPSTHSRIRVLSVAQKKPKKEKAMKGAPQQRLSRAALHKRSPVKLIPPRFAPHSAPRL
jgi:hypothetical protein